MNFFKSNLNIAINLPFLGITNPAIAAIWLLIGGIALPAFAQGRFDRPTFFQEGQQQLNQEIQRLQSQTDDSAPPLAIEQPNSLLTIDKGQLRWQKYFFRAGGFSVWLPQGLQSQETVDLTTDQGKLSFQVFATQPPNWRFIAAYSSLISSTKITPDQLLLAVQQGIINKTQFTLEKAENLPNLPYPARQFILKNQDEAITFRLFWIGRHLYVLAVGQQSPDNSAQNNSSQNITSFFNSFRLLP